MEQTDMVSALGLPMKRRPDSAVVSAIPVARKKRPVELPPSPKEAFKPEPVLPDAEYDYILTVIDHMSQTIERSPSTFVQMKEEQMRDLILVNLNGHYEGDATGETFNAKGKTDILIRADGRNVFIGNANFGRVESHCSQRSISASSDSWPDLENTKASSFVQTVEVVSRKWWKLVLAPLRAG